MKHVRELFWHYWLPLLVMLTLIKLESTDAMSGRHTFEHLQLLLHLIGVHLSADRLELVNGVMRKSGHVLGYGTLGFCWLLMLRGTYWLQHDYKPSLNSGVQVRRIWWRPEWATIAVICTFLVAAADELHQMGIPSRTGSWRDVALDTVAAVAAMALVWIRAAWRCRSAAPVKQRQIAQ